MLPKSERLKKSSEFNTVYNIRRSVANSLFILYTRPKREINDIPPKVGFVVGKKVSKKSTERNRIKRLMRESYRNIKKTATFPLHQWRTLIFIARPNVLELNYKQVYDAIVDCLKKANRKYGKISSK